MRARKVLANKKTECPGGFNCVLRHSWNWLKIKVFQFFLLWKRKKPTQTLISVPWKVPQPFSSTEEAIAVLSNILPVAFHSGFLPISPKIGFFHTKCVQKGTPMPFLVDNTSCSSTLEVLGYFPYIFATVVTNTSSARARTKKNTQKCQNWRFCYFCTQNRTFLTENGCKSTH